jgi:hypothetical protein
VQAVIYAKLNQTVTKSDMTEKTTKPEAEQAVKPASRQPVSPQKQRLNAALRANLRRRKAPLAASSADDMRGED